MQVIIDRFEEGRAVVEGPDGAVFTLDQRLLPGAKEGDVVSITIDRAETDARRKRIQTLMDSLFKD